MSGGRPDSADLWELLNEATQRPLTPEEAEHFRQILMRDEQLIGNGHDPDALLADVKRRNRAKFQPLDDPEWQVWEFLRSLGSPDIEAVKERSRILLCIANGKECTREIIDYIVKWEGVTQYEALNRFAALLAKYSSAKDHETIRERLKARLRNRRR